MEQQGWSQSHKEWLHQCQRDFASGSANLPGYTDAPPPKTFGYDTTLKKGVKPGAVTKKGKGPAPTPQPRSCEVGRGAMGPPSQAPPPRRPMLVLLAGRIKGAKATEGSPTTSSGVSTTSVTITSAIVSVLDAPRTSTSSLPPQQAQTRTRRKTLLRLRRSLRAPLVAVRRRGPKRDSDRPGREFTKVTGPKKQSKAGLSLIATLRKSEGEWQGRASAAEKELRLLKAQHKKLEKEYGELRTSSESDEVRLAAAEATERTWAD